MRLAVLPDFVEEQWPSMDLCAEMLLKNLAHVPGISASLCRPRYRQTLGRLPLLRRSRLIRNAERLRNRFRTYPHFLKTARHQFDFFHLCDHSYAHLVHSLPPGRTGVYCHDLDAFRCLFEPVIEPRPRWFRKMAARILDGLQRAACLFCPSESVRRQIISRQLFEAERVLVAPNGVADEFHEAGERGPVPLGPAYVLNVGSCIPRKRIGLLLDIFARVRRDRPEIRLVQIGGTWTAEQRAQIDRLGISAGIEQARGLSRTQLAECYRGAALVLQPSEAEGFGLPLVEGLACGAPMMATDLPVFREVGGAAVRYVAGSDVETWSRAVVSALGDPAMMPARAERLERARNFSWRQQAQTIADRYRKLAGGDPSPVGV